MKATRAHIVGLGTSGVLIGSFLLLLMVGSAIVAFRGAPGEATNDGVDRLDVTHSGQASRAARSQLGSAGSADRDAARLGRARHSRRGSDPGRAAGRVGDDGSPRGRTGDLVGADDGGGSAPAGESVVGTGGSGDGLPRLPAQAPQQGGTQSAPSVGGVAEDLGGAVERTSEGLGETVGEAAPPLQRTTTGAGEKVGGAVEETAPVIDETVSGVTGTVEGATEGVTGATGELPGTTPP